MKAYILENSGGVDKLQLKDVQKPIPKKGEVLIKVKSISINPVDVKARRNELVLTWIYQDQRPVILGWDISGEVVGTGNDVDKVNPGDKVFGMVNFIGSGNAYAEYVCAPVNHIAKIPENISFDEASASTLACLTALQSLEKNVKSGDKVLIHAGSGGVGHFAIQIAKHLGAYVIATSSAKNKDFTLSLGADKHIDYVNQKMEDNLWDVDFVLDTIGGKTLLTSLQVAKKGAKVITLPSGDISEEAQTIAADKNIDLSFYLVKSDGNDMETIATLLEQKKIVPHISKKFRFEDLGEAHLQIETGRTVGRIAVLLN